MTMKDTLKIDVIQDGEVISKEIEAKYQFADRDIKITYDSQKGKNVHKANFVGIIHSRSVEDALLFSMPKHYMNLDEFMVLSFQEKISHIKCILETINKYVSDEQYSNHELDKDLVSDFPFDAYWNIYRYYKNYGLYHNSAVMYKKGYGGKVSWKKTMSRATKLISNGNLIFTPFMLEKKQFLDNLITETMIFVLNYTQKMFNLFINLPNTSELMGYGLKPAILSNPKGIINRLIAIREKIFKDVDLNLINSLILFLERVNANEKQRTLNIKYYSYPYIWEKAVEKYLNDYLESVDATKLHYADRVISKFHFKKRVQGKYDRQNPKHSLEPDHYYFDELERKLYIFDSKYYVSLKELNHKQIVYHVLFGNLEKANRVYDALIIPTEGPTNTEVHTDIDQDYLEQGGHEIKIFLNKLNTVQVLANYAK